MTIPKQMLRMIVAHNTYRLANRLKQVLVLAGYQTRNVFEAIDAKEFLTTLQHASPVHVAILTPAIIAGLEQHGLYETLRDEFSDVALLHLAEEGEQEKKNRMKLMPDHVLVPPVTAESFDEAIAAAIASRDHRTLAAAYIAEGEAALKQGSVQEAQVKFEAALQLCGQDPYPAYVLGDLFATMGDSEQAIVYFTQAWEKDPTYFVAMQRIVELLAAQGEGVRAISYLETVVQQEAVPVEYLVRLGSLYMESGAKEKAKTVLQRACRIAAPEAIDAMQVQVRSLLERQEREAATTLLQMGIEAQPENTHLYEMLGELHMQQNRHREALVCYENVIRLSDPLPVHYCQLARLYMAMGFTLRAEKAVQQALQLDPECAEASALRIAVAG